MPGPARAIVVALLVLLIVTPVEAADPSIPPLASPDASAPTSIEPTPAGADPDVARRLATDYADALLEGRMRDAWDLLAAESHARFGDDASRFADERRAYLRAAEDRLDVGPVTQEPELVRRALKRLEGAGLEPGRSWVIELEYPALAWARAADDVLLAAPDLAGTWHLWWVR